MIPRHSAFLITLTSMNLLSPWGKTSAFWDSRQIWFKSYDLYRSHESRHAFHESWIYKSQNMTFVVICSKSILILGSLDWVKTPATLGSWFNYYVLVFILSNFPVKISLTLTIYLMRFNEKKYYTAHKSTVQCMTECSLVQ